RDFHGRVIHYGIRHASGVHAENVQLLGAEGSRFDLVIDGIRQEMRLQLVGEHNVYNALSASAVGLERAIPPGEIPAPLSSLRPSDKRGEVVAIGGVRVINDCYNSNPKALDAMVDVLASMAGRRRIVVAGEMLELGPKADALHRQSGVHIADRKIEVVIGV